MRQTYVEQENSNIIPQNRETTQNHRKNDHVIKSQDSNNYIHNIGVSLDSTLFGESMVNSIIKKSC